MRAIIVFLMSAICSLALSGEGDVVHVYVYGQKVTIVNGEEIIRRYGEQRGMTMIYDAAKLLVKHGATEGYIKEN